MSTHTHTYIHIYIYTHIHIYIYTHERPVSRPLVPTGCASHHVHAYPAPEPAIDPRAHAVCHVMSYTRMSCLLSRDDVDGVCHVCHVLLRRHSLLLGPPRAPPAGRQPSGPEEHANTVLLHGERPFVPSVGVPGRQVWRMRGCVAVTAPLTPRHNRPKAAACVKPPFAKGACRSVHESPGNYRYLYLYTTAGTWQPCVLALLLL